MASELIEIQLWDDADDDDDDDDKENYPYNNNNNNGTNIESDVEKQIAADIRQQQLRQQAQQQQHGLLPHHYNDTSPQTDLSNNVSSASDEPLHDVAYCFNDIVALHDGRRGKIKFIGTLGFESPDIWIGLILSTPTGSHNGTVKKHTYWRCKPNHGTFVRKHQIASIKVQRDGPRFTVDEMVETPKGSAWVRFIGGQTTVNMPASAEAEHDHGAVEEYSEESGNSDSVLYGVELVDVVGENSGFVGNAYYFRCAHCRGMFCGEKDLKLYDASNASSSSSSSSTTAQQRKHQKRSVKLKTADAAPNGHHPQAMHSAELVSMDSSASFDLDDDDDLVVSEVLKEVEQELSDSSSHEEVMSDEEVRRVSNISSTMDDRMSFARILFDFKQGQKVNVRSIASRYEDANTKVQQRYSHVASPKEKSEVEIASEIISSSRRQRADTMPDNEQQTMIRANQAVYHPPRFADQHVEQSHKYRNQTAQSVSTNSQQTTPVALALKNRTNNIPASAPKMKTSHSVSISASASTTKVLPPSSKRKRGVRGKAGNIKRIQRGQSLDAPDEAAAKLASKSAPSLSQPASAVASPRSDASSPSPELPDTIHEEPDDAGDQDAVLAKIKQHQAQYHPNAMSNGHTSKVPMLRITSKVSACQPPHLISQSSVTSVTSTATDDSVKTDYMSPGLISPGGAGPPLMLEHSHSYETKQDEAMCSVDEHKLHNASSDRDPQQADKTALQQPDPVQNGHDVGVRTSWMFKPAPENDYQNDSAEFQLKAKPDSPFDVHSTQKDFQKVAGILMLECNNPKNIFKVLKGVCAKLKLANPDFRRIDLKNSALRQKLLRFEGVEDFLALLGFKPSSENVNILLCDADQPPLSVLESAVNVCNDCLLKCNQKRATIDLIKKFSKQDLLLRKKRKHRNSRNSSKKTIGKKRKSGAGGKHAMTQSMEVLNENIEAAVTRSLKPTANANANDDEDEAEMPPQEPMFRSQLSVTADGTRLETEEGDDDDEKAEKMSQIKIIMATPTASASSDALVNTHSLRSDTSAGKLELPGSDWGLRTRTIRVDDATDTLDDLKYMEELEGDEDRFQLSDIVWSITHKDNTDKEARAIILLCFPTFSDGMKLLRCLIDRFFEADDLKSVMETSSTGRSSMSKSASGASDAAADDSTQQQQLPAGASSPRSTTYTQSSPFAFSRIESQWEVQVKVISFVQQWIRTYWEEDWDDNEQLLDLCEQFCSKIEACYRSDPNMSEKGLKKGLKLIKMINQAMDYQEASLTQQHKKKSPHVVRQGSVRSKIEKVSGIDTTVNKMRYDFVKIDNRLLAEQITLLDFKYFAAIKKRECLCQAWKQRNKYEVAHNVCALIDSFNQMSRWVQATILVAKTVQTRGRLIKKFIKIAVELLSMNNFQSLCAFHSALSSSAIHKLKHAWAHVPAKHLARFEDMRVIFNTQNNMLNFRKLHREAHPPLVPYTGLFLSDLISIEESNKKHKDDGTVNFSRLMRLAQAIDSRLLLQRTGYEFQEDRAVQSLLSEDFKTNAKLDADYIYKLSVDVSKRDQPAKKKNSMLAMFSRDKPLKTRHSKK